MVIDPVLECLRLGNELSAERAAHAATRTQLAATESRRAIQHADAVRLRQERAQCIAMLEKAREYTRWSTTPSSMIGWQTQTVLDEIDTLLSALRTAPAEQGLTENGGTEG